MKIAIIAFGSLLWEPGELELSDDWRHGGPELPIEFSRRSQRRNGVLTLVVDHVNGERQPTWWALSARDELQAARKNLQAREGAKYLRDIGYVSREESSNHAECEVVRSWLTANRVRAAIWTALRSNFPGVFAVPIAFQYLDELGSEERREAHAYMRGAAAHGVKTPLLRHLVGAGWLALH